MRRRTYLTLAASTATVTLAGCLSIDAETMLTDPEFDHGEHGVTVTYTESDDELLVISHEYVPDIGSTYLLSSTIMQPGDTELTATTLRLRPFGDEGTWGGSPPGSIDVRVPGTRYGETSFFRDDDWTVLEIESFDEQAGGTTSIGFTLRGDTPEEPGFEGIEIEHEVTVSGGGVIEDTYTARDLVEIPFNGSD